MFNEAQLELLNAMAGLDSAKDLEDLKHALSEFFARRADEELERLWENGTLNQQILDELRGQHLRTPYGQ